MSLDQLTLSKAHRQELETATTAYQNQLTSRVANYLTDRGIDKDTAIEARLGEVVEPLPGHERFTGRLAIPYLSRAGTVAIKFRCVDQSHDCKDHHHGKYDAPAGQRPRLYGVNALHRSEPYIAICEGEMSALVCTSVVGVPAVGTPGTTWMDHYARVFADYPRIFVVADNDAKADGSNPGMDFARKVAKQLRAKVVEPPEGLDLDEWVQERGADEVRKAFGV